MPLLSSEMRFFKETPPRRRNYISPDCRKRQAGSFRCSSSPRRRPSLRLADGGSGRKLHIPDLPQAPSPALPLLLLSPSKSKAFAVAGRGKRTQSYILPDLPKRQPAIPLPPLPVKAAFAVAGRGSGRSYISRTCASAKPGSFRCSSSPVKGKPSPWQRGKRSQATYPGLAATPSPAHSACSSSPRRRQKPRVAGRGSGRLSSQRAPPELLREAPLPAATRRRCRQIRCRQQYRRDRIRQIDLGYHSGLVFIRVAVTKNLEAERCRKARILGVVAYGNGSIMVRAWSCICS